MEMKAVLSKSLEESQSKYGKSENAFLYFIACILFGRINIMLFTERGSIPKLFDNKKIRISWTTK